MLKRTRITILLSLNAVAVLIAGILIASAIGLNKDMSFKVVAERSDVSEDAEEVPALIDPVTEILENNQSGNEGGGAGVTDTGVSYYPGSVNQAVASGGAVPAGKLWNQSAITIYQTADIDICVDGSLTGLGDMYWQTSNTAVISSFYKEARSYLGYSTEQCRFPKIVGTGTTTITAGTYDGSRRDSLIVTVIAPPVEQWKREVLSLVNQERAKAGLGALTWGTTCEAAANLRAQEIKVSYSHTRPSGAAWNTACPIKGGTTSGENLAAGSSAVSPKTVVASWMASPSHRQNILNPNFTHLSVGFDYDPNSQYKTYWSQYFTDY